MKNGDIKTSQTYTYNIDEAIGEGIVSGGGSGDGHYHVNLAILNSITQTKINEWNNKANKEHAHSDYAEKNHTHNANEIEGLDNIDIDLSSYYTKSETDNFINNKADKGHTHSQYLTEHQDISHKADKENTYTKSQTDNKISEEIAKAQLGGDNEVDLSAYATKNYVDDEISKIELKEGPQGPAGQDGADGKDGVDGKDFTYDMFTNEQLEALRGPKGEKGDAGDSALIHLETGVNLCNDNKALIGMYTDADTYSSSTKFRHIKTTVEAGQIVQGIPGADVNYKTFVLLDENENILGVTSKDGEYIVTRKYITIDGVGQHCYSLTVPDNVSMIYFQYQSSYVGIYNMLTIDNDMPTTYVPYVEELLLNENIIAQNSKNAKVAETITSPLKDKNIGFLGDSFTASVAGYHSFLAERTGCISHNYGVGGTRITLDSSSGESFIHRVASMRDNLDVVCVFGGINDASKHSLYETDYGTIDDAILTDEEIKNGTEPLTFYSGVKTLLSMLITKYPGKPIVLIIPPHVLDESYAPELTAYNGIAKIVHALRECAEHYAIPTIDLYKNAQYLNNHPTNVALYRTATNNIHPNTKAHIRMSCDIQKGLENIVF